MKIVSGGQTGADLGALDAALAFGIPCGGWCPEGRLNENGRIPEHYPLTELPGGGFLERTIKNVQESDGTLVLFFGEVTGGTKATVDACVEHAKPHLLLDGGVTSMSAAVELAAQFVRRNAISILNVAGPRASEAPGIYAFTFQIVSGLLQQLGMAKSD